MIQVAIIAVLIAIGGIAGGGGIWYLKQSALETCNADWKANIAEANLKLAAANEDKATALATAEAAAAQRTTETESKLAKAEADLAAERSKTPLSDPCTACRVPAARVRPAAKRTGSSHKTPYVIRHRQKVTNTSAGSTVPGSSSFGIFSPGTGKSP